MAKLVTLMEQHLDRQPPTVVIQATTWWETVIVHVKLQECGLEVHLPVKVCNLLTITYVRLMHLFLYTTVFIAHKHMPDEMGITIFFQIHDVRHSICVHSHAYKILSYYNGWRVNLSQSLFNKHFLSNYAADMHQ